MIWINLSGIYRRISRKVGGRPQGVRHFFKEGSRTELSKVLEAWISLALGPHSRDIPENAPTAWVLTDGAGIRRWYLGSFMVGRAGIEPATT